jgi:hypothetical protein
VTGLDQAAELNGLLWCPRLVGVAGDHELITHSLANLRRDRLENRGAVTVRIGLLKQAIP